MPNMAKGIMYNNTCYYWSFFVVIAAGGYLTAAAVLFSLDKNDRDCNESKQCNTGEPV